VALTRRGASGFASAVAEAYDATADRWATGPARVYDRMAEVLVDRTPVRLEGRTVLDVGAGTGAAARAVRRAGGRPLAFDLSHGMLSADSSGRGRAAVTEASALPVADSRVDGVVAAFSFTHLPDPALGLAEARRVCRLGSPVLASAYAGDDDHPAKAAVESASREAGWTPPPWYRGMQSAGVTRLSSAAGMATAARRAGLAGTSEHVVVELADLTPDELVAWRMGMAQVAPFLATLDLAGRRRVAARARELLGDAPPPLRRSLVVFAGVV
jgi:ubiquinone/menaquinone biosynthesis C-methylase UbiE